MEEIKISTEDKIKSLGIPYEQCHLKDVPDGGYFWVFGERWKKVETGEKYSIVIQEDTMDNYLGVLREKDE